MYVLTHMLSLSHTYTQRTHIIRKIWLLSLVAMLFQVVHTRIYAHMHVHTHMHA